MQKHYLKIDAKIESKTRVAPMTATRFGLQSNISICNYNFTLLDNTDCVIFCWCCEYVLALLGCQCKWDK